MTARRGLSRALLIGFCRLPLWLLRGAALLLSPFRLGRLLRTVSIPRFEEHLLRTTLTVLGIGLGNALLVAVLLIDDSIMSSFSSTMDDVGGKADLQLSAGSAGFDGALHEAVRATPGVAHSTVVLQQTASVRAAQGRGERVLVLGIDFLNEDDAYFRRYESGDLERVKADPVAYLNAPNNLILGRALAERLGLRVNEQITLSTPEGWSSFRIWGVVDDEGAGRAFGGAVAIMDYQAMQVAFGRGTNIDRIDIAVQPGAEPAAVSAKLKAKLGSAYTVERPARRNDRVSKLLSSLKSGLAVTALISMMVGMLLIYNTMTISIVQRRRELGVMRALGGTRSDLLRLLTLEGVLLGSVGSAFGVAMGIGLAKVLLETVGQNVNEVFLQVAATSVAIDPAVLAGCYLLGLATAAISAAFPAQRAARSRIVDALRRGVAGATRSALDPPNRSELLALFMLGASALTVRIPPIDGLPPPSYAAVPFMLLGTALLVPRLVLLLHALARGVLARFGDVEARLANENLPRDLLRTSTTAVALMAGLGMALGFSSFVGSFKASAREWVEQSLPADLWVTSGASFGSIRNTLMDERLRADLAAMEGVADVERMRLDDVEYRGFPVKLVATDIDVYTSHSQMRMLEGTQAAARAALRGDAIIVSENFARRFDVHVGQSVALAVRSGTRAFEVVGVNIDYTSDVGTMLMDRATYLRHWSDPRVSTYKLYLRRGVGPEVVRQRVDALHGERFDLFVLTNAEVKDRVLGLLDQTFSIMHALEIVAIVIAVLGVVNTLLANVLDRVRELGILRAIGMRRAQVQKMVVAEGTLIALCGVAGGAILGLMFGDLLLSHVNVAQTGWHFAFRPDWLWPSEMALLGVIASTLAGYHPARFAASLPVAEALSYE